MTFALQIELTIGLVTFILSTICFALLKNNYNDWVKDYKYYEDTSGIVKIIFALVGFVLFAIWLVFIIISFIWHLY